MQILYLGKDYHIHEPMPEASHVYRNQMTIKTFDPAGVACSFHERIFYKHTNPPDLSNDSHDHD